MRRVALAAAIFSAVTLTARAQSSVIGGRVVADDTGDPIPNARVSLTSTAPQGMPVVLADGEGRFALSAPPGRYTIGASKTGFAAASLPVADGGAIEIRLRRSAAISGRVVDEFGDPVPYATVTAGAPASMRRGSAPGARPQPPTTLARGVTTDTDDRGEYRLSGLAAGTFVVSVETPTGQMSSAGVNGNQIVYGPRSVTTYYPDAATVDEARALALESGENRPGIDFVVPAEKPDAVPIAPGAFAINVNGTFVGRPDVDPATKVPDPKATGVLRGRVVSTDGRAIGHAQVRLVAIQQAGVRRFQTVLADEDGQFEFTDLPASRVQITPRKNGYSPVPTSDTADGPVLLNSGRSIDLAEGETRERVDVSLARWGTMIGRVLDELGDPIQGASVQMLQVRYDAGRRRLVPAGAGARTTDDLGRYRLFDIPPGRYVVSAAVGAVSAADVPGYARSYFPGTPNPGEAQFVTMGISQDVAGIDFALSRTKTARVSGTLLDASGEPRMGGSLKLLPSVRSTAVTSVTVGARILADGRFEFPNVAPGQYIIQADRGRKGSSIEGEFGTLAVSVNGDDVKDLVLQTSTGSSITGRVTFDSYDPSKKPPPGGIVLVPVPIDSDLSPQSPATADVHPDWSFDVTGVNGPRRLQLQRAPAGWALKEIRVDGIDATDQPFLFGRSDQSLSDVEVVLTDGVSQLLGTIVDDRAHPVPGASLVVFSADRDRWYPSSRFVAQARADANGAFTIAGLPSGPYYAAAVTRLPSDGPDSWRDADYLNALLPRATTVTLGDGQRQSVNVRLSRP